MKKIDWKSKLSSRKFWIAVVGFVSAICAIFAMPDGTITQITTIIMSFGTMIAYIIGEGIADTKKTDSAKLDTPEVTTNDD